NFRRMASTILDKHIAPHRIQLTELFERLRSAALAVITQELEASLCPRLGPAGGARRPPANPAGRRVLKTGRSRHSRPRRTRNSANGGSWRNGRKERREQA